jgi:hypothetical protein
MDNKDFKILSILALQRLIEKKYIQLNDRGLFRLRKFDIALNNYYNLNKEELKQID